MKEIVIFSGTTEGRLLAESFAAAGIQVSVCVATEYGEEVMKPDPLIEVHSGRLDEPGMETFLSEKNAGIVFDATHPYAVEVSANIRKAAERLGIVYKRLERETVTHESDFNVTYVKNTAEAVQILEASESRILLTTGSKELNDFLSVKDRLFVRVLPSVEAIGLCERAGIEKSHIIAEQGPFTYEENLALLKRYDIGVLVTKASGKNGGYDEKIRAAQAAGVSVITIERPTSVREKVHEKKLHISVIGAGCGEETLTLEAVQEIRKADLIIGSERLLDYGIVKRRACPKKKAYLPDDILGAIDEHHSSYAVVLFSGDTGFYSGAEGLLRAVPPETDVRVVPGISSVQALSAAFHIPYDHAVIKSYHGVPIDEDEVRTLVSEDHSCFFLLSGIPDLNKIAQLLKSCGGTYTIRIGSDIGTVNESFLTLTPEELLTYEPSGCLFIIHISR
ncbi:MAG: precorrin-6A reductase [Lachnospiraceae bacterium]|nr:precorrin-6A reductase [Lachnospiraceae bacterium]